MRYDPMFLVACVQPTNRVCRRTRLSKLSRKPNKLLLKMLRLEVRFLEGLDTIVN
jgi:hypothetical protein